MQVQEKKEPKLSVTCFQTLPTLPSQPLLDLMEVLPRQKWDVINPLRAFPVVLVTARM